MEGKGDAKGDEFRLGNSVWFVGSTLLQQGAELTPMSVPGRIMGATFWFYALIMISTYTANLAAVFASTIFNFSTLEFCICSLNSIRNILKRRKKGSCYLRNAVFSNSVTP